MAPLRLFFSQNLWRTNRVCVAVNVSTYFNTDNNCNLPPTEALVRVYCWFERFLVIRHLWKRYSDFIYIPNRFWQKSRCGNPLRSSAIVHCFVQDCTAGRPFIDTGMAFYWKIMFLPSICNEPRTGKYRQYISTASIEGLDVSSIVTTHHYLLY